MKKKRRTMRVTVKVPEWARWDSTDKSGARVFHAKKPVLIDRDTIWGCGGRYAVVAHCQPPKDPAKTLRRIKQ